MLRIAVIGSESSGKTTLAKSLSTSLDAYYVEEYSREYLNRLDDPSRYNLNDLTKIAEGQFDKNSGSTNTNKKAIICDTEMLTMKIWSIDKFNLCPVEIEALLKNQQFDLYILCKPDIPWIYDPLREDEKRRELIHYIYKQSCLDLNLNFIEVYGNIKNRIDSVTNFLNS